MVSSRTLAARDALRGIVLCLLVAVLASSCGLFKTGQTKYDTTTVQIAISAASSRALSMFGRDLSTAGFEDVVSVEVVVSGEDKYGVYHAELARVSLALTDGAWVGTINDLPVGPQLVFAASALDAAGCTIYTGSLTMALTETTGSISIALAPVGTGQEVFFPVITAILRPQEIVHSTSAEIRIETAGNEGEQLELAIASGGGTFSPESATSSELSASGVWVLSTSYAAPDTVRTYRHTVTLTNSQGNSVQTAFPTTVVYATTNVGVQTLFAPAILRFQGRRDGAVVTWIAEVSDDKPVSELRYHWEFDGGLGFIDPDVNPGQLDGYAETTTGTVRLTVTDADDLATTVSFTLVARQFPDGLVLGGVIGPVGSAPGGATVAVSYDGTEANMGAAGGVTFAFSGIGFDQSRGDLYWGIWDNDFPSLCFDGSVDVASEVMSYAPAESNLPGGTMVWSGSVTIPLAGASLTGVPTRLTVTVTGPGGAALPLTSAADLAAIGMPSAIGAVLPVTGDFSVNLLMEISVWGWQAASDGYNIMKTSGDRTVLSDFRSGFYYLYD